MALVGGPRAEARLRAQPSSDHPRSSSSGVVWRDSRCRSSRLIEMRLKPSTSCASSSAASGTTTCCGTTELLATTGSCVAAAVCHSLYRERKFSSVSYPKAKVLTEMSSSSWKTLASAERPFPQPASSSSNVISSSARKTMSLLGRPSVLRPRCRLLTGGQRISDGSVRTIHRSGETDCGSQSLREVGGCVNCR